MKSLFLASLLFALPAMAAEKTEVIHENVSVSVLRLHCVVFGGTSGTLEDRLFTQLGTIETPVMILDLEKLVSKVPKALTAKKCDLDAVDEIVKKSRTMFGFVHGAPLEVIKHTEPSFINGNGHCVARYEEAISLDIGGIVLTAKNYELLWMNDCVKP